MTPDTAAMKLQELKALAKAATPGPWATKFDTYVIPAGHVDRSIGGATDPTTDFEEYAHQICTTRCKYLPNRDNAEFIAACDPQTILTLLADRAAMAERLAKADQEIADLRAYSSGLLAGADSLRTPAAPHKGAPVATFEGFVDGQPRFSLTGEALKVGAVLYAGDARRPAALPSGVQVDAVRELLGHISDVLPEEIWAKVDLEIWSAVSNSVGEIEALAALKGQAK